MSAKSSPSKWISKKDLFTVVCRPALPMDTQQVMELTRLIWEGEDYIPYVWEEWLSDHEGLLAVAEYGGRVIALGKLSLLAPRQWWLEGLRVHPEFQGQGVGSHLHNYLYERWSKIGDGVIRLATGSNRLAVHRMSERTGFKRVGEVTLFKAAALDNPGDAFKPLDRDEIQRATAFALVSESMQMTANLLDLGWKWTAVNPYNLAEAIEERHAWWWRGGEGLLAIWEEDWEEETGAVVMCIACKQSQIVELLGDFRRLAGTMEHKWAMWFVPATEELFPLLEKAGYVRDWDDSLYILERQHP